VIPKRFFVYLVFFFAFEMLAFAGESPYNANQPKTIYLFCTVHESGNSRTVYYSGIFLGSVKDLTPIQSGYLQFLEKTYSYKAPPGVDAYHMPVRCYSYPTSEDVTRLKTVYVDQDRNQGNKVTDTGWTNGAKKITEPTASPSSSEKASNAQDDKLDPYTQATLEQDPNAARLSPIDRQFVISEAKKAKSYCAKDPELSQALDCNCFVRTVFNYRIAHASGPIQTTNFPPLATLLDKADFNCSECAAKRTDSSSRKPLACEHH